ncbi:baseplate J/gp47 family protein [Lysinibacillus pakistanensis]|uniref:baseplate J/gp47 family protein n=1 Tax=Lysinibacillus pakistanensis TaxID=759811 RepID=UPI003D275ACD
MSVETILQNMLNNTDNKFDKSDGSWTYDVEKAVAIELGEHEVYTGEIIDKINIENLTDKELTRFVFQRTGIKRNVATFATGEVLLTVTAPTSISAGELVAAENIFYQFINDDVFNVAGQYVVAVEAIHSGEYGNVPVGAINSFPTTLPNVSAVTNEVAFTNGYPAETDASLRQRYYDKLQRPGKAGNKYHYREWAHEVAGVGKVKVFPRWNGPLTVKVAILDINNELAPPLLISEVYKHIEQERPFGAFVTVVTAEELVINLSGNFTLKSGFIWSDVESLMTAQITKYFKDIAFEDGLTYISHAQVGREILSVPGIEDYANLQLNGSTGNIPIGELEVAVVGTVTNV